MNAVQRRKLSLIIASFLVLVLAAGLILYALRQNISLFYTPSDISLGKAPQAQRLRLGGMVVPGSLQRFDKLKIAFQLTDYQHTVTVYYEGILPDLFREGQGIVALGSLTAQGHFQAQEVLAKHDENYMPPEVKHALNQKQKAGAL